MAKIPGFWRLLSWAVNRPRLRRSALLLGGCFTDPTLLDGEFDELFLAPLRDTERAHAAGRLGRAFDPAYVHRLAEVHGKLNVPVQLVWGDDDPFFPLGWTREMVEDFPDARLHVVRGMKLFVHEEAPAEVAEALLPTLLGRR